MTSSGSPCGACKFLRRKCVRGCIFAAYFCHEQAAKDFAAIHRVFGASNVSKLLAHLPVTDRHEAAATITYEAHARIQDPVYGCVSHISALQQQVANLQAQLTSLKQQAARSLLPVHTSNPNPSGKLPEKLASYKQDVDVPTWSQLDNPNLPPQFTENLNNANPETMVYDQNRFMSLNSSENSLDSIVSTDQSVPLATTLNGDFQSLPSSLEIDTYCNRSWNFQEADNELRSVAFGYNERCW